MSPYVESQLHVLEVLKNASPKLRTAIIKNVEPEVIEAISEICHNYVKGNVKCEDVHYNELQKHQDCLRLLAASSGTSADVKDSPDYDKEIVGKRGVLLQQGEGFWLALLAPLISELASHFISKFVKKPSEEVKKVN